MFTTPTIEVRIKDQSGSVIDLKEGFKFLQIKKELNKPGYYQLIFDDKPGFDSFQLDSQVEFIRKNLTSGIAPYVEFEAFHRTEVRAQFSTGRIQRTSFGRGYLDLINRRVIAARAESNSAPGVVGSVVSLPAGEAIERYVLQHAGSDALAANGRIADGVTPGLSISFPNGVGVGAAWDGDRAYRNLLEVVREISGWTYGTANDVYDIQVVGGPTPATFDFQIVRNGIGTDRTETNGSVPPVIFSTGLGDVRDIWYSYTRSEEINRVYALGSGDAAARIIGIANDLDLQPPSFGGTGIDSSPWNMIEVAKNAPGQDTAAKIDIFAAQQLLKTRSVPTVTFVPAQSNSVKYGRDYFLGDLVTVYHEDKRIDTRIVSVELQVLEDGEEMIKLEFSTAPRFVDSSFILLNPDGSVEFATRADIAFLNLLMGNLFDQASYSLTS